MRHVLESNEYWVSVFWMQRNAPIKYLRYEPGKVPPYVIKECLLHGTLEEVRITPDECFAEISIYLH